MQPTSPLTVLSVFHIARCSLQIFRRTVLRYNIHHAFPLSLSFALFFLPAANAALGIIFFLYQLNKFN